MSDTATLSSTFQIRTPEAILEKRKWETGQNFAFILKGSGVLLIPVPDRDTLKALANGASASETRDRQDRF